MKTKLLKNIGIYYIILTLISVALSFYAVLYIFIPLLPILTLGILLIIIYSLKKKKEQILTKLTQLQLKVFTVFLIVLPFIFYIFTLWYVFRPYKQAIVIPKNYEGVITIKYNKPNGQPKKWIGGFLGIGASRLIEVDSIGMAETQFYFHHNAIPFLGLKQTNHNRGGLNIFYEDDLKNEIIAGANGKSYTYENKDINKPNIYFTGSKKYPLIIFVIAKKENYNFYFMDEIEKEKWRKSEQKKSTFYIDKLPNRLKNEINP